MPDPRDLQTTFRVLKGVLAQYVPRLHVTQDTPTSFLLDGEYVEAFKRPMRFAGVQIRRAFVAVDVMPVYSHPELLGGISDPLRKRLQGRAAFTFVRPERELLVELSALIDRGFTLYEELGWVK
jgi:hypothetical protein